MGAFKYSDIEKHNFMYMHNLFDDIDNKKRINLESGENAIFSNSQKMRKVRKLVATQNFGAVKGFLKNNVDSIFVDVSTNVGYRFTEIDKSQYSKATGSGGGSRVTKLSESAVCIILASLVHTGKFNLDEQFTIQKVNNVLDLGSSNTKTEVKKVLDWLKTDSGWLASCMATAVRLKSELNLSTRHHFHRDSVFMHSIYKRFQRHLTEVKKLRLNVRGDKWNPSDIWISTSANLPATADLVSLNSVLLDGFNRDALVGVSLKKVGPSVTYRVYNIDPNKSLFRFDKLTPQSEPFKAKDVYIETKAGLRMQIRNFGGFSDVQCELKGRYANNGKCGHGALRHIVESLTTERIHRKEYIKKMDEQKVLSEIAKYYTKCGFGRPTVNALKKELTKKQFKSDNDKLQFLVSKLQALQIGSAIKNDKEQDSIVTGIYGYAHSLGLSELFEASVYAKVF